MKKNIVGITIGLFHEAESLWINGIKLNALFLAQTLRGCDNVGEVFLVNTTSVPITSKLPWDITSNPVLSFDIAKDCVDVLIELGGQIDYEQTAYLKNRGCRLVSYCCGFEYLIKVEKIIKNIKNGSSFVPFINQKYDDIWMIPQIANSTQPYLEVLRRQSARVVPFVWSAQFLEQQATTFPEGGRYLPRKGPARLTVMEPNINFVKFALYPTMIAELAYRQCPEDISILQVTNSTTIRENNEFIALMGMLDIVREHKSVFLDRHNTPEFLATNTDIVISHQIENPLNYFYLDVCWQGYPLIHNAWMAKDLGYYYEGQDLAEGARKLIAVLKNHDNEFNAYREIQRVRLQRYFPNNPQVLAIYTALLDDLTNKPIRR